MSPNLAIVLVLLVAAVVMFAINRPRLDAVALIKLTAPPSRGCSPRRGGGRLQRPNIVLIAALFVIGESLVRTAVARRLGDC